MFQSGISSAYSGQHRSGDTSRCMSAPPARLRVSDGRRGGCLWTSSVQNRYLQLWKHLSSARAQVERPDFVVAFGRRSNHGGCLAAANSRGEVEGRSPCTAEYSFGFVLTCRRPSLLPLLLTMIKPTRDASSPSVCWVFTKLALILLV